MDESFEQYFVQTVEQYPNNEVRNIEKVGFIKTYPELKSWYLKGKILLIPSPCESFGMVTIEGGVNGCVVLGSDIISFHEIF